MTKNTKTVIILLCNCSINRNRTTVRIKGSRIRWI